MDSYIWIMYAGIATWTGIGLYVCFLARRQARLSRRLARMEQLMEPAGSASLGREPGTQDE